MTQAACHRLLLAILCVVAGSILASGIYFWQMGYNSDYAMIGLMAKWTLRHGHPPIFVWKVGYQGTILEASAVALCFKLFGVSPYTLNLAPLFFCILLLTAYYFALRSAFDRTIALVATIALSIASPHFYESVLRTQPNYSETYLFGCVLFLLYSIFLKRVYVAGERPRAIDPLVLGSGVLAGFAFYTYGQIIYFFEAIVLHALLLYLRQWYAESKRRVGLDFLFPVRSAPGTPLPLCCARWTFASLFCAGVINAVLPLDLVTLFGQKIHWSRVVGVALLCFGWMGLHLVNALSLHRAGDPAHRRIARVGAAGLCGFLAGYAPKIYYNLILRKPSMARLNLGGNFADVWHRVGILLASQRLFFNLDSASPLNLVVAASWIGCSLAFLIHFGAVAIRFIRGEEERGGALTLTPIYFLFFTVIFSFLSSNSVSDLASGRYTLALYLFYSVAIAFSVVTVWRKARMRPLVGALALLLAWHGLFSYYEVYHRLPERYVLSDAIDFAKEQGIRFGYGNYWYAYSSTFLTNEELILEPFWTNYHPDYEAMVKGAERIVVFDSPPYGFLLENGRTEIRGVWYGLLQKRRLNGIDVFVLKRQS